MKIISLILLLSGFAPITSAALWRSLRTGTKVFRQFKSAYKPIKNTKLGRKGKYLIPKKKNRKQLVKGAYMGLGFEAASALTEHGFEAVKVADKKIGQLTDLSTEIYQQRKKTDEIINFLKNSTRTAKKLFKSKIQNDSYRTNTSSLTQVQKTPSIVNKIDAGNEDLMELLKLVGKQLTVLSYIFTQLYKK